MADHPNQPSQPSIVRSPLPPPEPPDQNGTRPRLDLVGMLVQVERIQRFLWGERERERAVEEEEKKKGEQHGSQGNSN